MATHGDFFSFFGQSPAPECHRPPLLAQSPESGAEAIGAINFGSPVDWRHFSPEKTGVPVSDFNLKPIQWIFWSSNWYIYIIIYIHNYIYNYIYILNIFLGARKSDIMQYSWGYFLVVLKWRYTVMGYIGLIVIGYWWILLFTMG